MVPSVWVSGGLHSAGLGGLLSRATDFEEEEEEEESTLRGSTL